MSSTLNLCVSSHFTLRSLYTSQQADLLYMSSLRKVYIYIYVLVLSLGPSPQNKIPSALNLKVVFQRIILSKYFSRTSYLCKLHYCMHLLWSFHTIALSDTYYILRLSMYRRGLLKTTDFLLEV